MRKISVLTDARDYQIIFLTLFLVLGVAMRDWSLRPEIVGTAVFTALAVQRLLAKLWAKKSFTSSPLFPYLQSYGLGMCGRIA